MVGVVRRAVACAALAGCIPVSYWAPASQLREQASTLQRESTAVVSVDVSDDQPTKGSPSPTTIEEVRLDQPVRVRFAAQPAAQQAMTIADLLADCPPELADSNATSDATRLAYPRCRLLRADAIRLHGGHRANKSAIVLAAILTAVAGDVACVAECGHRSAAAATDAGLAIGLLTVGVGPVVLFFYELDESFKGGH
jgi:hypothetical protein